MTVIARALDGSSIELKEQAITSLTASLRGTVITGSDPRYDTARTLWNAMIDRRPALIVRCLGTADVLTAVNFARERGLLLAVRGGGHNIAGLALADGAVVLDMSAMRGVFVNREKRVANAQAGCLLGDVDQETQLHGLATVLGFISATGIAGLTLGGGFGYLTRRYGWSCDNVESFQVVLADGKLVTASERSEPELFWALRGGGGNFGVVTDFEYKLYPVGPEIVGGAIAWRLEDVKEVFELYRRVTADAPREMVCTMALRLAAPVPWIDRDAHGKPIVLFTVCDHGPVAEAEKRANLIKSFGKPVGDTLVRRPYTVMQSMFDAGQPNGRRRYWKSEYVESVTSDLLETLLAHCTRIVSPLSALTLFPLNGKLNELPEDYSAAGNRKAGLLVNIMGAWEAAADDARNIEWARAVWEACRKFSTGGTYVNILTEEEADTRIHDAYGANYQRLAEIKAKYDPQNFFRVNKNIRPR